MIQLSSQKLGSEWPGVGGESEWGMLVNGFLFPVLPPFGEVFGGSGVGFHGGVLCLLPGKSLNLSGGSGLEAGVLGVEL